MNYKQYYFSNAICVTFQSFREEQNAETNVTIVMNHPDEGQENNSDEAKQLANNPIDTSFNRDDSDFNRKSFFYYCF